MSLSFSQSTTAANNQAQGQSQQTTNSTNPCSLFHHNTTNNSMMPPSKQTTSAIVDLCEIRVSHLMDLPDKQSMQERLKTYLQTFYNHIMQQSQVQVPGIKTDKHGYKPLPVGGIFVFKLGYDTQFNQVMVNTTTEEYNDIYKPVAKKSRQKQGKDNNKEGFFGESAVGEDMIKSQHNQQKSKDEPILNNNTRLEEQSKQVPCVADEREVDNKNQQTNSLPLNSNPTQSQVSSVKHHVLLSKRKAKQTQKLESKISKQQKNSKVTEPEIQQQADTEMDDEACQEKKTKKQYTLSEKVTNKAKKAENDIKRACLRKSTRNSSAHKQANSVSKSKSQAKNTPSVPVFDEKQQQQEINKEELKVNNGLVQTLDGEKTLEQASQDMVSRYGSQDNTNVNMKVYLNGNSNNQKNVIAKSNHHQQLANQISKHKKLDFGSKTPNNKRSKQQDNISHHQDETIVQEQESEGDAEMQNQDYSLEKTQKTPRGHMDMMSIRKAVIAQRQLPASVQQKSWSRFKKIQVQAKSGANLLQDQYYMLSRANLTSLRDSQKGLTPVKSVRSVGKSDLLSGATNGVFTRRKQRLGGGGASNSLVTLE